MTTLFIHIGYPKTATTTFQKHVFPNHPEVDYLGKFIPGFRYKDERLYPAIDRLMTVDENDYEGVAGLRELVDGYRAQCSKPVMLISSESFVHVTAVDLGLVAQRIKAAFGPCRIIITIREQLDIIRSWYGMHGRFGQYLYPSRSQTAHVSSTVSIDEWLDYVSRVYDKNFLATLHYDEIISFYVRLFGKENVGVFLFEEFVTDQHAYMQRLCDFMGVDLPTAMRLVEGRHEYPRLTTGEVLFFKMLLKFRPRFLVEPFTVDRAGFMLGVLSNSPKGKIKINAKWIEILRCSYRDGNRALNDKFGLSMDKYGYCV